MRIPSIDEFDNAARSIPDLSDADDRAIRDACGKAPEVVIVWFATLAAEYGISVPPPGGWTKETLENLKQKVADLDDRAARATKSALLLGIQIGLLAAQAPTQEPAAQAPTQEQEPVPTKARGGWK